ncbi:TetR/AcrR family transcriptional regulator [Lentzea guizhouensis]|uniref:TetR/AcrR family transcriptional regulator n=1 Tax=Lentzea guizhouensis TaxID=1586287 RepID=UPI000AF84BFD|nr:TetR/AcrR family transcriptional regulator [Lentzea guizhouensis]
MIDSTSLPLVGAGRPLRADAVRNQARLLEAAARLAAERGAAALTMEAVAVAAGVGKGTVSRRFGDRNGLLQALLDHAERQFQEAFLSGPPRWAPNPALLTGCTRSDRPCCTTSAPTSTSTWPRNPGPAGGSRSRPSGCGTPTS